MNAGALATSVCVSIRHVVAKNCNLSYQNHEELCGLLTRGSVSEGETVCRVGMGIYVLLGVWGLGVMMGMGIGVSGVGIHHKLHHKEYVMELVQ
jgi:hypothetical protein